MNLQALSETIGNVLYSKGVFGHVTVDLISFPDPQNPAGHPLFYAVDLNCFMTDYAVACINFDLLLEGKLQKITGQYFIEAKNEVDDSDVFKRNE
jgi:IQ domain-containing protein H